MDKQMNDVTGDAVMLGTDHLVPTKKHQLAIMAPRVKRAMLEEATPKEPPKEHPPTPPAGGFTAPAEFNAAMATCFAYVQAMPRELLEEKFRAFIVETLALQPYMLQQNPSVEDTAAARSRLQAMIDFSSHFLTKARAAHEAAPQPVQPKQAVQPNFPTSTDAGGKPAEWTEVGPKKRSPEVDGEDGVPDEAPAGEAFKAALTAALKAKKSEFYIQHQPETVENPSSILLSRKSTTGNLQVFDLKVQGQGTVTGFAFPEGSSPKEKDAVKVTILNKGHTFAAGGIMFRFNVKVGNSPSVLGFSRVPIVRAVKQKLSVGAAFSIARSIQASSYPEANSASPAKDGEISTQAPSGAPRGKDAVAPQNVWKQREAAHNQASEQAKEHETRLFRVEQDMGEMKSMLAQVLALAKAFAPPHPVEEDRIASL